jgi:hypothetical protein
MGFRIIKDLWRLKSFSGPIQRYTCTLRPNSSWLEVPLTGRYVLAWRAITKQNTSFKTKFDVVWQEPEIVRPEIGNELVTNLRGYYHVIFMYLRAILCTFQISVDFYYTYIVRQLLQSATPPH